MAEKKVSTSFRLRAAPESWSKYTTTDPQKLFSPVLKLSMIVLSCSRMCCCQATNNVTQPFLVQEASTYKSEVKFDKEDFHLKILMDYIFCGKPVVLSWCFWTGAVTSTLRHEVTLCAVRNLRVLGKSE